MIFMDGPKRTVIGCAHDGKGEGRLMRQRPDIDLTVCSECGLVYVHFWIRNYVQREVS